jgi:hypothetical protein
MLDYRDRRGGATPASLTNITGLRGLPGNLEPLADPKRTRGFVTSGELAILHPWDANGVPRSGSANTHFVELGSDGVAIPDSQGRMLGDYRYAALDPDGPPLPEAGINPIDDPSERLAQFRALGNIVSSRSDVFVAWFVLRGYDPEAIERIEISGSNPSEAQAINAMDDPANDFKPAYESRWLVVFDRSNVKTPTDRPRVLLQVELPSARP